MCSVISLSLGVDYNVASKSLMFSLFILPAFKKLAFDFMSHVVLTFVVKRFK